MNKYLALALCLLVACGDKEEDSAAETDTAEDADTAE